MIVITMTQIYLLIRVRRMWGHPYLSYVIFAQFIELYFQNSEKQKFKLNNNIFFYLEMIKIATNIMRLTHNNKYTYIPPSCYKIQTKLNPVINVTLGNDQFDFCVLQFRLFENVVPRTSQNFKRLLLGTARYQNRVLSLINNKVHEHVPRAYLQFGHLAQGNCSIFGPTFRDQSFQLLHDRPGLLTSISQQNTNNSRFAITLAPCSFMDYKNTIFGQITAQSIQQLKRIERLGKDLFNLKIKRTEQVPLQIEAHGHGHSHHH